MKDQCYEFIKNQIGKTNIVGFGSYGQVKIAKNIQNNQIVAIKLIHGKNAKQQIDVHHKLNHPNIIKLLNYYYQKQKNITYMVLQYAQNGSLNQKIKFGLGQLSKQLIRKYFKGVCQAIKYLHNHNYMHRDIKPENILITKDNVAKLCDFGFAAMFESRTTMCGTFQYMAPQMIKKKHYTYKIDIWALGILLFQMIQGIALFRGQTGQEVISQMKKPIKFSQRFQFQQIDLIKKILRVNAQNRPKIQQILQHPYFKSIKQEDKINHARNTVQSSTAFIKQQSFLIKQSSMITKQPNFLVKQQFNSSKQQLGKFFKPKLDKSFKNTIDNSKKQRSPFRQHIKTEPAQISTTKNSQLSYKTNKFQNQSINNQQSQQFLRQDFKKFGITLKQTQNRQNYKGRSPLNSTIQAKKQLNIMSDYNLKGLKKNFYNPNIKSPNSSISAYNTSIEDSIEVKKQQMINLSASQDPNKLYEGSNSNMNPKNQQLFINKKFSPITLNKKQNFNNKISQSSVFTQQKNINTSFTDQTYNTKNTSIISQSLQNNLNFINKQNNNNFTAQSGYRYENIPLNSPSMTGVGTKNGVNSSYSSFRYNPSGVNKLQNMGHNQNNSFLTNNIKTMKNDDKGFMGNPGYNIQKPIQNVNSSFNNRFK